MNINKIIIYCFISVIIGFGIFYYINKKINEERNKCIPNVPYKVIDGYFKQEKMGLLDSYTKYILNVAGKTKITNEYCEKEVLVSPNMYYEIFEKRLLENWGNYEKFK